MEAEKEARELETKDSRYAFRIRRCPIVDIKSKEENEKYEIRRLERRAINGRRWLICSICLKEGGVMNTCSKKGCLRLHHAKCVYLSYGVPVTVLETKTSKKIRSLCLPPIPLVTKNPKKIRSWTCPFCIQYDKVYKDTIKEKKKKILDKRVKQRAKDEKTEREILKKREDLLDELDWSFWNDGVSLEETLAEDIRIRKKTEAKLAPKKDRTDKSMIDIIAEEIEHEEIDKEIIDDLKVKLNKIEKELNDGLIDESKAIKERKKYNRMAKVRVSTPCRESKFKDGVLVSEALDSDDDEDSINAFFVSRV